MTAPAIVVPIPFYPSNPLILEVELETIDLTTGRKSPLTTGTVTAFIATSNIDSAVAASGGLTVTAVHTNGKKWLIAFSASQLTFAVLNPIFSTVPPTPYLIIVMPSGIREYTQLQYFPSKPAALDDDVPAVVGATL